MQIDLFFALYKYLCYYFYYYYLWGFFYNLT